MAWGLVDAVMYLINTLLEHARNQKVADELRRAKTDAEFRMVLEEATPHGLVEQLDDESLTRFREWLHRRPVHGKRRLDPHEFRAAVQVWVLVFTSTLPLVVPFMLIDTPRVAMRVSQAIAVVMMFGMGARLARWIGGRPWVGGLLFAATGAAIAVICIALGG